MFWLIKIWQRSHNQYRPLLRGILWRPAFISWKEVGIASDWSVERNCMAIWVCEGRKNYHVSFHSRIWIKTYIRLKVLRQIYIFKALPFFSLFFQPIHIRWHLFMPNTPSPYARQGCNSLKIDLLLKSKWHLMTYSVHFATIDFYSIAVNQIWNKVLRKIRFKTSSKGVSLVISLFSLLIDIANDVCTSVLSVKYYFLDMRICRLITVNKEVTLILDNHRARYLLKKCRKK